MIDPSRLSASDALRAMERGSLSCVSLVEACLARVHEREPDVQAWAHIDPERALGKARERDRGRRFGSLFGIPVGVKDVIDTVDMPTQYGSPIYSGHQARWDAASVALLRETGAVILGKTETTEFALRHPSRTRNPHNLAHTPGGSSSGSAAAVADFMVPLALGTQTTGSTIRPGSYCGVVAFKPTFGTINRTGLKPLSDSQDTISVFARTVEDAALLVESIGECASLTSSLADGPKPRIGFCRTPQWDRAEPSTRAALEDAASRVARSGASVFDLHLPPEFDSLAESQEIVADYEIRRALSYERLTFPEQISTTLSSRLAKAETFTREAYHSAQRHLTRCRLAMTAIFEEVDAIIAPSAPGEAPRGHAGTGDPVFQKIWQALHVPSVNVPALTGPQNLPLGVQIISDRHQDGRALYCAEWVRRALQG
jgi:Asp-tRNA(Asn)/Glu-tRNA(Gln) amidotransferase A subunit family amidase